MSLDLPNFQIEYAIVCDQVRREDNGKLIAIGIYGRDVVFPKVPAKQEFSLLMRAVAKKAGPFPIFLRWQVDTTTVVVRGHMEVDEIGAPFLTSTPALVLPVNQESELVVSLSEEPDRDWVEIVRLPLRVTEQPNPSSTASQQPS